ncbi:MAG TPA: transporter associated domain-containing protein, partial [Pyrinomonadaceae bacterium]|nr:transporter associated domain-containing protein [Pyrinomonadaceae bacterium]
KLAVPESESYTTIGGFLMTVAGHVLKPAEVVEYNGLVFKVERVERRRVVRIKLIIPPEAAEAETTAPIEGARAAS